MRNFIARWIFGILTEISAYKRQLYLFVYIKVSVACLYYSMWQHHKYYSVLLEETVLPVELIVEVLQFVTSKFAARYVFGDRAARFKRLLESWEDNFKAIN